MGRGRRTDGAAHAVPRTTAYPVRMSGSRAAFLPLAVTFGGAALIFFMMEMPVWMAFAPMAFTFLVLALVRSDDEPEDDDEPSRDAS